MLGAVVGAVGAQEQGCYFLNRLQTLDKKITYNFGCQYLCLPHF